MAIVGPLSVLSRTLLPMTGGEAAAAATAAGKGIAKAGKALGGDDSEKERLADMAKDSPYMQLAADEYAKRVAIRQTVMTKLMAPLWLMVGMRSDYFENQFAEDLARKTAHLSEDELVAPKPSVAAQAMQGLGFSLGEPDLKEMYLNLITTASTRALLESAHPAFADIIKQLSTVEARNFKLVANQLVTPLAQFRRVQAGQEGETIVYTHVVPWVNSLTRVHLSPSLTAAWIDNWFRLGLIEFSYTNYLTSPGSYDWVEGHPDLVALRDASPEGWQFTVTKGYMGLTEFGRHFYRAVVGEPAAKESPLPERQQPSPSDG